MKKFINKPDDLTKELLEGLALSNQDIIELKDGNLVVNKGLKKANRVTVVTLGGTGHEPAISGFVGAFLAQPGIYPCTRKSAVLLRNKSAAKE